MGWTGRRSASPPSGGFGLRGGGSFQVFTEQFHVEVAVLVDPLLVDLDGEGADQPQAALLIGEDAHEQRAAFDLLDGI